MLICHGQLQAYHEKGIVVPTDIQNAALAICILKLLDNHTEAPSSTNSLICLDWGQEEIYEDD